MIPRNMCFVLLPLSCACHPECRSSFGCMACLCLFYVLSQNPRTTHKLQEWQFLCPALYYTCIAINLRKACFEMRKWKVTENAKKSSNASTSKSNLKTGKEEPSYMETPAQYSSQTSTNYSNAYV